MNRRSFLTSLLATVSSTLLLPLTPIPTNLKLLKIPIKKDLSCHPNNYKMGWCIYESIGTVIINDYAISKITLEY